MVVAGAVVDITDKVVQEEEDITMILTAIREAKEGTVEPREGYVRGYWAPRLVVVVWISCSDMSARRDRVRWIVYLMMRARLGFE